LRLSVEAVKLPFALADPFEAMLLWMGKLEDLFSLLCVATGATAD
jgi:hypothetical protein